MSLKSGFLAVLDRLSCRIQRWTEAKVASLSVGALALVVALTILVYGFNLGGARALTYHELYVACGAKQMAANGDLVLPRIGDRLWLEKPPLSHWLVLVSASVG
jgi:4-amino-4-deoxy-L-arabinose transferase-like glycosyltransferase